MRRPGGGDESEKVYVLYPFENTDIFGVPKYYYDYKIEWQLVAISNKKSLSITPENHI